MEKLSGGFIPEIICKLSTANLTSDLNLCDSHNIHGCPKCQKSKTQFSLVIDDRSSILSNAKLPIIKKDTNFKSNRSFERNNSKANELKFYVDNNKKYFTSQLSVK